MKNGIQRSRTTKHGEKLCNHHPKNMHSSISALSLFMWTADPLFWYLHKRPHAPKHPNQNNLSFQFTACMTYTKRVQIQHKKLQMVRISHWHGQRRPETVPVRKSFTMKVDGPPRGKGKPKKTWMEIVKIDLKMCNLSEDLAQDRSEWRNKIHVVDHNTGGTNDDDDDDFPFMIIYNIIMLY